MKITCPSCGSKYAIADDKVRGRRVKVRCKSCSEPIIVDGSSGDQELEATRAEPVFTGQSSAPPAGDVWSVNLSDTDQRSMTTNEIVAAYGSGVLNDAYVWKEGMGDWVPLASAPDLAPYLSGPQHSAPANEPSGLGSPFHVPDRAAEPARVSGGRTRGRADLFGGIAHAGSEEEALAAASVPPSSSESRMTGQRNENSVLFSLDALKAGVDAPRPAPARGGGPAPASKDDKASLDDIMSLGGGSSNPLFSMHANQALLAAPPPPPEPPPRPATPVDAMISSSVAPMPATQKGGGKTVIAISAAVGLLAILGIVAVLVLGKGKEDDKTAKTASGEKTSDGNKSGDDKGTTASGERPTGTESTTGGTDPAVPGSTKVPVTEEEKKRFAEAMKKKEEEDKKNGTTPDPKKEEEDTKKKENPSSGVGSFDKGAAIAALSGAAAQASGCKRPGGPTGSGKAIVTFAPSGRVTSANVSGGEFGGSPVGSCVASVFRRASVPAFNGDPVTVSKSFNIAP